MSLAKRVLHLVDWSNRLVPYGKALQLQESQADLCKQRLIHDTLILLQHPPTYTIGLALGPGLMWRASRMQSLPLLANLAFLLRVSYLD
ncbi:hypothetical protein WJX74_005095 [Apatococcus lobatus]|uniref:Uncharacterized protein n=2 Tax=Apatococcus TaxID=904362 RepID=A0AAW1SKT4_9CHLO